MTHLPDMPTLRDLGPRARRLADRVPGVYLTRDRLTHPDRPLLRLLEALAAPLDELERAIDQLHRDHFVETASGEALPFLADLVGTRIVRDGSPANRALIARWVHWLRRKGTLSTLEDVVAAATGWSTEAEEAFRSIMVTQWVNNGVPHRGRTATTWNPVALADPLSRAAPGGSGPREGAVLAERARLIRAEGESLTQSLLRLGRADAGRVAIAPRNIDFADWAQPHVVLVRTSRLEDARIEARDLGSAHPAAADAGTVRAIPHAVRPDLTFLGATLDPMGGVQRVLWEAPAARDIAPARLTEVHEPDETPLPQRRAIRVLTPTALADDPAAAEEGDALHLAVDGVTLIGGTVPVLQAPAAFAPVTGHPVLRLADADRPGPEDRWVFRLVALDNPDSVPATVAGNVALGAPGAENVATLEHVATRGAIAAPTEGPAARVEAGGATAAIRVTRTRLDRGYRRAADGTWSGFAAGVAGGAPLSDLAPMADGGPLRLVRLERRGPDLGLAALRPDDAPGWSFVALDLSALAPGDRPDGDAPLDGPIHALAGLPDGTLLLVGANEDETQLGIWRIADPLGTPAIARVDGAGLRPPPRLLPAATVHDGRLLVFGGADEDSAGGMPEPRDDLWSVALVGADAFRWTPHRMRFPREVRTEVARLGAMLLSTPEGPVLIGGASTPGRLSPIVLRADLAPVRPRWHRLPDLPLDGGPGALWAGLSGGVLRALVWDDSTAPRLLALSATASRWHAGPAEADGAPNPPAAGEALFDGDRFIVAGPPPLPPSEVIFSSGGAAQIAFLPALDLPRSGDMALFTVETDGSTARWFPAGEAARMSLRLGAGQLALAGGRRAPASRIGAAGRLAWRPLRLRQVSLAPWDGPLALDLADAVGFDPRLGRIALRRSLGPGRLTATFRTGRSAPLGPGFSGREDAMARHWPDPTATGEAVRRPPPSDLRRSHLDPARSGLPAPEGSYAATLTQALGGGDVHVVLATAARLAPASVSLAEGQRMRIGGAGPQHVAHVAPAADGTALALRETVVAGSDPDEGPQLWLADLDIGGRIDVQMSAGRVDLAWCWLGRPGTDGVSVLGAGLQTGAALKSIPRATLVLHLLGCHVGRVRLPAWVHLVATGCTFDAGSREDIAIDAPGARVRLRHATVCGRTRAGALEASSCVFAGAVACDRPDLGFLRYSVLPAGGRAPCLFKSLEAPVSFTSTLPGDPTYLALDINNPETLLAGAERGQRPGAHPDRAGLLRELDARTEGFLPMGLEARHQDRTRIANLVMNRWLP